MDAYGDLHGHLDLFSHGHRHADLDPDLFSVKHADIFGN